ncbi:MAG TPA: DUF4365 domain-containing protein [Roseivirga sp.]
MPLTVQNIESELSYAYLHAIASKAGLNCKPDNRHGDNYAVDAIIDHFAPIPDTYVTDVSLRVQLKATTNKGAETETHISYWVDGVAQYDKLRTNAGTPHRILVVLFLPKDASEWLKCTEDELIMKQAAYWVCLYGAEATTNGTGCTVKLPKVNLLTPDSLVNICQEIGKGNLPTYNQ